MFVISYFMHFLYVFVLSPDLPFGYCVSSLVTKKWISLLHQHSHLPHLVSVFLACNCAVFLYTGCPRRKGQNFRRVFLMLKYTDITQNTYIQSLMVTEIIAREKCGLLAGLRTVPCQLIAFRMSVLDCHVRLQKYRWRSYVSTPLWLTMHVMEPLRTTMTWVRVFL